MRRCLVLWVILSGVLAPPVVRAQGHAADAAAAEPAELDPSALELARALEARITVWRRPSGAPVHVTHCRFAVGGCRAQVVAFARFMTEVGREHDVDPFVLAAMAVRESGLDPFARGPAGEMGIVQLHPRGIGGHVRFVQSEPYRNRCRRMVGACQREVLDVGATHLADAMRECGGLEGGLGYYNRGQCGETAYTRRVLRERDRLVELAKGEPPAFERALVD